MKILHTVEFYAPSIGGSQEVVRQLSEHMVALGHEVTIATSKLPDRKIKTLNGVEIKEFAIKGNLVRGIEGEAKKYQDFLVHSNFDVIMNYAAQQWATDLTFEVLDKIKAKKIIVPCGYSGLYLPEYQEYFRQLPKHLKKYHASVYLSDTYQDIEYARKHNLDHLIVIPNGVDEREFSKIESKLVRQIRQKISGGKQELILLTVGNHTGSKGHQETIEVINRLSKSFGNIHLVIVGKFVPGKGCWRGCTTAQQMSKFKSWFGSKVRISCHDALSRAETVALFAAADLFVFLSNIEASPLVLFETAAAGTPFVASDVGNSREIADWTKAGVICTTTTDSRGYRRASVDAAVSAVLKLLTDKHRLAKMGERGLKETLANFTWEKITKRYLDIYDHN